MLHGREHPSLSWLSHRYTATHTAERPAHFVSSKLRVSLLPSPCALFPITGLLVSPHLVNIRERIRLEGKPIREDLYLRYFWQVWDKLVEAKVKGVGHAPQDN